MYKKIMGLVLLSLILSLTACKLINKNNIHEGNAEEALLAMNGYAAIVKISNIDNDKATTYEAKQIYQMDGKYRFEVLAPERLKGLTTVFNGEKVVQYNPQIENAKPIELPLNNFRNQIFLGTFVKNYLQSEEVAIAVQNIDEAVTTVLEAVIPGGSQHMSTQKLWLDQKTRKPLRMVIYNKDQQESIMIEFLDFAYNPEIDESIFNIQ